MNTTLLSLIAAAPTRLNPLDLFLQADIVVKTVMIGLILASLWVWTIIVSFSMRMGKIERRSREFEADFWDAEELDSLTTGRARKDLPSARVAAAGVAEWKRSTQHPPVDREGTRHRLAGAMESQVAKEADDLSERLNFLATVGSVAPFVGLFGTGLGHHEQLLPDRDAGKLLARGGRARHCRGAVRDRYRPVRRDPRGDRLQPLQPPREPL